MNCVARFAGLGLVLILVGGCGGSPKQAPEEHWFVLSNPRIERLSDTSIEINHVLHVDLARNPEFALPSGERIGLLTVFCAHPGFDIRPLGRFVKSAYGKEDPLSGTEVFFETLIGKSDTDYVGAWWLGYPTDIDWNSAQTISMTLTRRDRAGIIDGKGHMTVALVRETVFGEQEFVPLCEPLAFSYDDNQTPRTNPLAPPPPDSPSLPPEAPTE